MACLRVPMRIEITELGMTNDIQIKGRRRATRQDHRRTSMRGTSSRSPGAWRWRSSQLPATYRHPCQGSRSVVGGDCAHDFTSEWKDSRMDNAAK